MENNKHKARYGAPHEPEGLTFKQLKANAIKKWYLFVIFILMGVGIAYVYNRLAPYQYRISTTILIKPNNEANDLATVFKEAKLLTKSKAAIHDQVGVIKSFSLNLMALQSLNWRHSWYKKRIVGETDLYNNEPFTLEIPKGSAQADMIPVSIKTESACMVYYTFALYVRELEFEKSLILERSEKVSV